MEKDLAAIRAKAREMHLQRGGSLKEMYPNGHSDLQTVGNGGTGDFPGNQEETSKVRFRTKEAAQPVEKKRKSILQKFGEVLKIGGGKKDKKKKEEIKEQDDEKKDNQKQEDDEEDGAGPSYC